MKRIWNGLVGGAIIWLAALISATHYNAHNNIDNASLLFVCITIIGFHFVFKGD